ncbi:hypothetical protein TSH100_03685 [Azospirillum sp. TSH100]|uniref:efflux RND transporter periplasmic adaptor subunit n=1 Tax=Azospirillum sp. TSH100 TaxID=652764 RepID=UPI000D6047CA|nr:HlyD family efflux transporter periplasmic adaptor subunit [Azospirillum sp. TSH100]PWC90095.1 hypothetical protein TSH100_03685 [Azospirillum sp. TSH100]QCG90659.1 HlyD family efflux transporter periplasmic adaptor subunit [Azospirillum sp. TSH100]
MVINRPARRFARRSKRAAVALSIAIAAASPVAAHAGGAEQPQAVQPQAATANASAAGAAGPAKPTAQPPTPAGGLESITQTAGAAAGYLYQGSTGLLWSAGDMLSSAYTGIGQALYETAYMMGVNKTPLPRPEFVDTATDHAQAPVMESAAPVVPTTAPAPVQETAQPTAASPAQETAAVPDSAAETAAAPPPEPAEEQVRAPLQPIPAGLLANLVYDRSARNADGSYFVPKGLQRMFEVRTERAAVSEVRAVRKLNGRVVPDPKAHGRVEAGLLGRFEAPETGIPVVGDEVRKGQILGMVVPVVGVVDRSSVRREIARLTNEIRITAESLEITKQFSFVPFREGKVIQLETRLQGLRQEREALLPLLKTQEYLRAPVDGVIASSTAVTGRVTQPGEMVFDIVNPKQLWVEVTVPDPTIAAEASPGSRASARTPEGQSMAVTYMGSGPSVRQQSIPMLFRIDNPPKGLRVGRPVAVLMPGEQAATRGMPVRRAAVAVGSDGIQQVWEQTEPETFVPRVVQTQDIDAQTVLVLNGVTEGARIVVRGTGLMTQLQ